LLYTGSKEVDDNDDDDEYDDDKVGHTFLLGVVVKKQH
jgi:hypothetical protein